MYSFAAQSRNADDRSVGEKFKFISDLAAKFIKIFLAFIPFV